MAADEKLTAALRAALARRTDVVEKKMFGGLTLMVAGHMCCGAIANDLMFRVGPERYAACLKERHARPMDFTGKPIKGTVFVAPEVAAKPKEVAKWVDWSLQFVASLPVRT